MDSCITPEEKIFFKMKSILQVILIVALNKAVFGVDVRGSACSTPKRSYGECISLENCEELFVLLKKRPVSTTDLLYLQQSTCDRSGDEPRVCCPRAPPPQVPTPNDLVVTDITQHKNFRLLPDVSECGRSIMTEEDLEDRIIGGQDAGLGQFPWMALLGFAATDNEPVQYACGGTLINSQYVLTAAHCVHNLPFGYKLKTVRLGEYNQTSKIDCELTANRKKFCAPPVQNMDIDQVIAHENYDKTKSRENDIALVRLKKKAALGPYVSPVCLPRGEKLEKSPNSKNEVFVTGWGRLAYDSPENAPILQKVSLKLVSMENCNRFYANKENFGEKLDDGRFCAGGDEGFDSCKGDSGGPLMIPLSPISIKPRYRIFQLGVVSLGPSKCGHAGQPALYSKVSHFLKWIFDNIRP